MIEQTSSIRVRLACIGAALFCITGSAPADPVSGSGPVIPSVSSGFTPKPATPPSRTTPFITPLEGAMTADAGLVDAALQTDAEHVYTLKNSSSQSVRITGVRGTCGCEHMALLRGGVEQKSLTLQPGQDFQVRLGVKLEGQPVGTLIKTAWVLGGPSGTQTLASLSLSFRVRQAVVFMPQRLDMGDVTVSGSAIALVTMHLDKMPDWTSIPVPQLASDNPTVTAVKVSGPVAEVRDGKPGAAITYRINVSHLSLIGPYQVTLRTVWPADIARAPAIYAIPVSYRAIGSLAVAPLAISFAVVQKGVPATRSLVVFGKSVEDLKSASVEAANTWLSVQGVSDEQGSKTGASGNITVTLTAAAPPGALQSLITIRTKDGEKVQVPVTAFVGN